MAAHNSRCQMLWEKTRHNGARLLRIFGDSPAVTLPEQIAGFPLTELGNYCFAQTAHLPLEGYFIENDGQTGVLSDILQANKSVGVNVNITNYKSAELAGSYITSVKLPDSLVKIGDYAFYNCKNLSHIEFGSRLNNVGSDAFMNCHKLCSLDIRCSANAKSGLRRILAQIPWDVEVSYIGRAADQTEAVIFYPEYDETYDEIAPAHIFGRSITGEGFRARQCFKDGAVDYAQYDAVFQKASAEESQQAMCHLALCRLRYPVGLSEEKKAQYRDFIRLHGGMLASRLVAEKQLDALFDLFSQKLLSEADAQRAVVSASETGWSEGCVSMMRWKQSYYQVSVQKRYEFDDF